jgi:hypothetical protein
MTNRPCVPQWTGWALGALTAVLVAVSGAMLPDQAWAAVVCPGTGADADGDGFTDAQECAGITTLGTGPRTFPRCNGILQRVNCVDPNSKDVFVIYRPVATGSRLAGLTNPFDNNTFLGIGFTGLSGLGVTVHQLTPTQAATDRTVSSVSLQKAVRISESVSDGSLTADLGYCQFGTPQGLDGCVVYTRRTQQFIDAKCNGAGDTITNRNQVFLAYATYIILHETGHSLGGLAAQYDAAFGGYHYSPIANLVMSQAAQYSTQAGRCTWYIPSVWNPVLDPPAVLLK